ncbi:hypothetical protein [Streptomyces sp. CL12-4]|uniref:hypothetical protein n=1 Tax=Streptomyces sp. CL12-4 TaxID=2810306 RepID=UPI001EFAB431|nr:hypothetical protein [Streptomyces sp. CL12-4]MCG8968828.1 hypothetical protein [Streptomyces sp. CL12-4]
MHKAKIASLTASALLRGSAARKLAMFGTGLAVAAATALTTAPTASASSWNGCEWPGVCFYQTQTQWNSGNPTAVYQDITSYYQNLSSAAKGANWVFNSRNDDRAYLRYTVGGSTRYWCLPPDQWVEFPSGYTVTHIRIDTASSC